VLILLPPSEGKHSPARGKPLDLATLSFSQLAGPRAAVLHELVRESRRAPADMLEVLGLGAGQADEVARDARLERAPTARADRIYTGVLYDALDLPGLDAPARRRATRRVLTFSGLFGVVGPADRIPAYRLSGQVRLPGLGSVARHWSQHLAEPLREAAGDRLVVDLRSSAYTPFWRPLRDRAERVATVRVLHEQDGRRTVVSHFNKATKGRIVRALLQDGRSPRTQAELVEHLRGLGWQVEPQDRRSGSPQQLDVVVRELGR
jgi:cytoplasmic iron level regulating protein YaaA (DUF328/UPF0246 family)